ncbi:MAG: NADPH:quinone oxidoreductase family protein [Burkholderiales bacterium]|nr:NADPH:quinone oxidoreductase family protein [Burkholderiales bacterium]
MHGWVCSELAGADALRWQALPLPEPGAGELRVAIHAASVNFPDLLVVEGKYQVKPALPFVPGAEFAGRVDAVGPGVAGWAVGDAIAVIGSHGGFATHAVVKAAGALRLPAGFDLGDGAAFAFTYGTSHHALIDRGRLRAGETVLVLGAAGGVGSAAVQIAKAAGARVIAAASSAEKCAFCAALGADATIDYGRENLREAIKRLTDGRGPDLVYDPVGGELAEPAFRSIAWRGRYLVVGFAGGAIPALPWNLALLKGAEIVGVFWGDFIRREAAASAAAMDDLARWYARGLIRPAIGQRLPMSELKSAYRTMAERRVMGKLLLLNT